LENKKVTKSIHKNVKKTVKVLVMENLLCFWLGWKLSSWKSSCVRSSGTTLHLAFARHAFRTSL